MPYASGPTTESRATLAPGQILAYERGFWRRNLVNVAGVDEVGRGPIAGPVVAAAVILAEGVFIEGATDSKALTSQRRGEIAREIHARAAAVALGAASVREIDRHNILQATTRAMTRALTRLPVHPDHVVVDGLPVRGLAWEHEAVVGGDALVHSIACASIVAKVCRDRLMKRLAPRYPRYGWERNKGYATRRHRRAVREAGLTPHHRTTFGLLQLELPLGDYAEDAAVRTTSGGSRRPPPERPGNPPSGTGRTAGVSR